MLMCETTIINKLFQGTRIHFNERRDPDNVLHIHVSDCLVFFFTENPAVFNLSKRTFLSKCYQA